VPPLVDADAPSIGGADVELLVAPDVSLVELAPFAPMADVAPGPVVVDCEVEGIVSVADDAVPDSRFVHAPSETAAATARAAAPACVRVVFIGNSLDVFREEGAAAAALNRL
jgi:hypothetical protein